VVERAIGVDRTTRLLAAAAFGFAGLALSYAAVRCLGALLGERESPASVLWVEHSALRWAVLISVWLAGLAAAGGWAWSGRDALAATLWLRRLIALAAAAILTQGLLVP